MDLVGFFTIFSLYALTGCSIVRIAHLLPPETTTQHEPLVLAMCLKDMKERFILPKELDLQ